MVETPAIDVVIPVHDASRPLDRAVRSLLESGLELERELRIDVVCHNIAASTVGDMLGADTRPAVRLLEFADGQPSPAGAFMHGIRSATAEYVSIMGSDDTLEPRALREWLQQARDQRLDALIPPERHASGAKVATPPVRPFRRGLLDPVRDRLAYRTAPLGLFRRRLVDELGLDMPPRLRSGSDQLFGLKLWFSGVRIAYGHGLPKYVVGADAKTRVTFTPRPAEIELRAVHELVTDPWVLALPPRTRRMIVTKSLRVHVFSAALVRSDADRWTAEDRAYLSRLLDVFAETAPDFTRPLSLVDRRLVDALADPRIDAGVIASLLRDRRRYGHPVTVLTRDARGLLAVDGPIRFMVAAKLL